MGGYALGHYPLSPTIRRGLNRCAGCGLILAILLATATCCWAATYRWVDESGRVHYGDKIPPQYAGQGHSELNSQGRVTRRVEGAANSVTERQRREREAARLEAEAQAALQRQRQDSALLATFSNVTEIEQARVRALSQELALLESLRVMRKHSESKAESAHIEDMIHQREKAIQTIRAKYDADKARYIELTGRR